MPSAAEKSFKRRPHLIQSLELIFEEGAFGSATGAFEGALVGFGGALSVAGLFPKLGRDGRQQVIVAQRLVSADLFQRI